MNGVYGRQLRIHVLILAGLLNGMYAIGRAEPPASQPSSAPAKEAPSASTIIAQMNDEAAALRPLYPAPIVQKFLDAVKTLPAVKQRTLIWNRDARQARLVPPGPVPTTQPGERILELPEQYYYTTRYGTPLAYARPMQILGDAGVKSLAGAKILDFGYGTIGHLRLWATCGADVVGVEVDPTTEALYSLPGDIGVIKAIKGAPDGKISLATGHWPGEKATSKVVQGGYDIIISKNTLKRGYVHPAEPVDKRMMVDLGVSDEEFVAAVHAALKPGGRFLIYNICPAPSPPGKPYIPWSDGRCPFDRKLLEDNGFRVDAFDQDDSENVRRMAKALGWDKGASPMDLENDLFAHFTLMTKPISE